MSSMRTRQRPARRSCSPSPSTTSSRHRRRRAAGDPAVSRRDRCPELRRRRDRLRVAVGLPGLHRVFAAADEGGRIASADDGGAAQRTATGMSYAGRLDDPLSLEVGGIRGCRTPTGSGEPVLRRRAGLERGRHTTTLRPAERRAARSGPGLAARRRRSRTRTAPDVSFNAAIRSAAWTSTTRPSSYVRRDERRRPAVGRHHRARQRAAQPRPRSAASDGQTLYRLASSSRAYAADFHDITQGDNMLDSARPGISAGRGYDLATGLGAPDVAMSDLRPRERAVRQPVVRRS